MSTLQARSEPDADQLAAESIAAELELDPRPDHPGRIPDFFVAGHPKSGTTALYAMLAQHPQLFLGLKEPRFFCTELRVRDPPRPGGTPQTVADYMAWYRDAAPEQLVGDVSPGYLWSQTAPELIAKANPEARIIVVLREPASFLRSLHMQWMQSYVENEADLRTAIELEGRRREGLDIPSDTYWPKGLFYSDHVRYVEQLRRYHSLFGKEQVLVLIHDDYRRDNDGTVREVLRFLGVDENATFSERVSNPSVQVQSPRLHALIRRLIVADQPAMRALNRAIKALTPMQLRQDALHMTRKRLVYSEPERPDEEFMSELRRRYRGEVAALGDYLGRDMLALWGYDS